MLTNAADELKFRSGNAAIVAFDTSGLPSFPLYHMGTLHVG
jgi:hypothetical protein